MKETGLLFKPDMIKQILLGNKTQTRRIIKPQPFEFIDFENDTQIKKFCPLGKAGDLIYVKEAFQETNSGGFIYKFPEGREMFSDIISWKSPVFMPKAAARIWLEVVDIKVERLQDIIEEDAIKEGVKSFNVQNSVTMYHDYNTVNELFFSPIESFKSLWKFINGAESWDANPFVWCVEFKKIQSS